MRRSGLILALLTGVWVLACIVLGGKWFLTGFDLDGGKSVAETHEVGFWGLWLWGVLLGGSAALGLVSLILSRRRAAIAFGVVTALLFFPVQQAATYAYRQLHYQPCTTVSVLWDCPTDLD